MQNKTAPRNPVDVIDQMLEALGAEYPSEAADLKRIKSSSSYRAPELQYLTWDEMQEVVIDIIPPTMKKEDMSETQKRIARIFTNNPTIV